VLLKPVQLLILFFIKVYFKLNTYHSLTLYIDVLGIIIYML